jgi:RNA polymerase sigma-70 factor (ECF subfamily)
VQETFVRLARRPPPVKENLRPWLFTIATNLARDEARRWRRRERLLQRHASRQPVGDPPADPAEAAERADLTSRVRQALDELNAKERSVLLLAHEGFTHREIAQAVHTTPSSVGTMIARALDKLAVRLDLDNEGR